MSHFPISVSAGAAARTAVTGHPRHVMVPGQAWVTPGEPVSAAPGRGNGQPGSLQLSSPAQSPCDNWEHTAFAPTTWSTQLLGHCRDGPRLGLGFGWRVHSSIPTLVWSTSTPCHSIKTDVPSKLSHVPSAPSSSYPLSWMTSSFPPQLLGTKFFPLGTEVVDDNFSMTTMEGISG